MNALTDFSLSSWVAAAPPASARTATRAAAPRTPALIILRISFPPCSARFSARGDKGVRALVTAVPLRPGTVVRLENRQHHDGSCGRLAPEPFAMAERGDNATQRSHLLFRRIHPGEHCPQVSHDVLALVRRIEKAEAIEFAFEMLKEAEQLLLGRRPGAAKLQTGLQSFFIRGDAAERPAVALLEPLVAYQQHGLGEIEGSELWIDRRHHDGIRHRHLVRLEPGPLRAENNPATLACLNAPPKLLRRLLRRQNRLGEEALARSGSVHEVEIPDRLLKCREGSGAFDDEVGARGGRPCFFVRPPISRSDQP